MMMNLLLLLSLFSFEKPDIVIFYIDDVAADDIAEVPTPNIDALATQGTDFSRGYAQPKCAPSRLSIMHSEWLGTTAGLACNYPASPRTISHGRSNMPKTMESVGYTTSLFGRWGLGGNVVGDPDDYPWTPQLWGFEFTRELIIDGSEGCIPDADYFHWQSINDGVTSVSDTYLTTAMQDAFLAWWPNAKGRRFSFVSFQAAHGPFHWPPASAMPPGWVQPSIGTVRAQYRAMIQSVDVAVGNMMESIDLSTTLVILLADNGTPPDVAPSGQSNRVKFSTFERGIRVPFIIAGLGFPSGQVCDQPVSEVDLIPTLIDLTGGTMLPEFDGQSLLPAIWGERLQRDWVYVQDSTNGSKALIEKRWKLTEKGNGQQSVFDLENDPNETSGVLAANFLQIDVLTQLRIKMAKARQP